jgi:hypothetical protein
VARVSQAFGGSETVPLFAKALIRKNSYSPSPPTVSNLYFFLTYVRYFSLCRSPRVGGALLGPWRSRFGCAWCDADSRPSCPLWSGLASARPSRAVRPPGRLPWRRRPDCRGSAHYAECRPCGRSRASGRGSDWSPGQAGALADDYRAARWEVGAVGGAIHELTPHEGEFQKLKQLRLAGLQIHDPFGGSPTCSTYASKQTARRSPPTARPSTTGTHR